MNPGVIANASYLDSPIAEYKGNPLIEALPPILSETAAAQAIASYPAEPAGEPMLEASIRLHCIDRLRNVIQPLPIHLELESALSLILRSGYVGRNPMRPSTVRHLHGLSVGAKSTDGFTSTATTFSLVGLSGIGKSTALEAILRLYPQTILHRNYQGREFLQTQIVWLKLDCPFDGSLTGLCHAFFRAVDQAIGQRRYADRTEGKRGVSGLIHRMEQLASTYYVGALLIDELQHLQVAKSGGKDNMLNFFVNLLNSIGIPVVFVGTNTMIDLFADVLRNARRACGMGLYNFRQPAREDPAWNLLVDALWRYQWVRHIEPLTPAMRNTLYDQTQGITDFLAKLLILGQRYAIQSGTERLTEAVLRHVAETKMQLLQPALAALRSGDPKRMRKFDDLMPSDALLNAMMTNGHGAVSFEILGSLRPASALAPARCEAASEEMVPPADDAPLPIEQSAKRLAALADPMAGLREEGWLVSNALEFESGDRAAA
jgi:hypothetical protein